MSLRSLFWEMGLEQLRHDYAYRAKGTKHTIVLIHRDSQEINEEEVREIIDILVGQYNCKDLTYKRYEQIPGDYRLAITFYTRPRASGVYV